MSTGRRPICFISSPRGMGPSMIYKTTYTHVWHFPCKKVSSFNTSISLYPTIRSSGYNDELALAAIWLYKATEEASYLQQAKAHIASVRADLFLSWDIKTIAAAVSIAFRPHRFVSNMRYFPVISENIIKMLEIQRFI